MQTKGFSLFNLLVTICLISILMVLAIPSFSSIDNRTRVAANAFLEDIITARTHAVALNKRVTMAAKSNWNQGWVVFIDSNNDGILNSSEKILDDHPPIKDVAFSANSHVAEYISFTGTGESHNASQNSQGAFQAGTFHLCRESKGLTIVLTRGGRARINSTPSNSCP